jgi:hypothetical protein
MPPMLIVNRRVNTIKQLGKGENVHQRSLDITQLSKNSSSKNVIKNVFDVNPFGHLKHKLGPKERPGVKLAV